MADTSRGFNKLKGATIKDVSASCVNHVMLLSDNGFIFMIDADVVNGIPVMKVKRYKETFVPLPDTSMFEQRRKARVPKKD